jgi:hypothetical protein
VTGRELLFGALVLIGIVASGYLAGCDDRPRDPLDAGGWYEVRPYPGAPEGTRCWVGHRWFGDGEIGGPECAVAAAGGAR